MESQLATILFSLTAAASWGSGDFNGGLASKRASVYTVVAGSQLVGLVALIVVGLLLGEAPPAPRELALGAAAGLAGAVGLLGLYRGLADGKMGVVAPLTAVTAAGVPVIVGTFLEGPPAPAQMAGIGAALLAVWIISVDGAGGRPTLRALATPLAAGISFGLFFVLLDQLAGSGVIWPLAVARLASLLLLGWTGWRRRPRRPAGLPWRSVLLAGLFDSGGNLFFTLAAGSGRLDLAAVVSALYPATTVLLAWLLLHEPLARRQVAGLLVALLAVMLISS